MELLYLGGNFITAIPPELANLPYLSYLVLCDNRIQGVPPQLTRLHSLRSLSLHNNLLTYLPREILSLVHLQELSLRGNPLVVRFVKEMTYDPPSLLELAGRMVKSRNVPYSLSDLPSHLLHYLDLASKCPNPKLHSLRSLSLHNNLLTYLPREILSLVHLQELSLRGNPLVVRFVKEMTYDPPSLLELAGRMVKSRNVPYSLSDLPSHLLHYLDLASKCPNPKVVVTAGTP
ncbi:hypothetical protein CRUP_034722 [Coryphaenoides rupestris]|nr:hypothetical protein CRUP_034722 [Coryphaenoides rupestris]